MKYTDSFNTFKSLFSSGEKEIRIPGSAVRIHNIEFRSQLPPGDLISANDKMIGENRSFTYPVFSPPCPGSGKAILLFHGLNERSWVKYLSWAFRLANETGSHVILFPISFHINRSPASWGDPREMVTLLKLRNSSIGEIDHASFANLALSNRLTEDPLRFFKSGYQTVDDVVRLTSDICNGLHPVVPRTGKINIFAYSIGAFLAEILMLGNPDNLYSESRLFIFCGGSVFSSMRGTSRLIMDKRAFDRVYNYYLYEFEDDITGNSPLVEFLRTSQIGMAFRSMIDTTRFRTFRENILRKLRDQIKTITLAGDTVIPSEGVAATLGNFSGKDRLSEWDFPFSYSHENPFPVLNNPQSHQVDNWFDRVFEEAIMFLC